MSDAYQARERQLLDQLAWQTVSNPKAPADEKRAARARLERSGSGPKHDWNRLSVDEMCMVHDLMTKAEGIWPPTHGTRNAPPPSRDDQRWQLQHFAEQAQIVADDARIEFDVDFAAGSTGQQKRCEACGRYGDNGNRIGSTPGDIARRERLQRVVASPG